MAEHNSVSLPVDSEFLTPASRVVAASSASATANAAAQEALGEDLDGDTQAEMAMMQGIEGCTGGSMNIFDTSDILNTTLLDGSLWPGQL